MKKLFVGNLPYQATEAQLQDWFTQAGVSTDAVTFIRDRSTGQSRGFGFVEVSVEDDADRAIHSLNGRQFLGRSLVVNEARPAPERRLAGGAGGGRRW